MPKLRDLRPVDVDFATTGPNHNSVVQAIPKSADAVFRCLEDGPSWHDWLGIEVEWTSPEPFGVGTTRTVTTTGQRIDEYFLAWEPGRRMCFRFDRCTLPVAAFAEDYVITPTGDTSCEIAWHYAYEWTAPLATVTGPIFARLFALNGRRSFTRLAELMAETTRFDDE